MNIQEIFPLPDPLALVCGFCNNLYRLRMGYLRLATPVYNISATVLIKDDKKGGGASMSSELEKMGLDGFVPRRTM